MSFKNAVKIFFTRFSVVWSLLLYMAVFLGLMVGLSMPFLVPIAQTLRNEGIPEQFLELFNKLFSGISAQEFSALLESFLNDLTALFTVNRTLMRSSALYITLIVIIAFRFFVGIYEIPLSAVLDGWMSSKAKYGFFGKSVSTLWLSVRFVLAKMLYTIMFDAVAACIFYGMLSIMSLNIFIPFLIMLLLIIIYSLRFSLTSSWAASIVSDGMDIIPAFFKSVRMCFKNFKSVYSCFIIAWLIIIVVNLMFGVFTFGAALVMTLPMSTVFISALNMTLYYTKSGKRFYADNVIVTPPINEKA